MTRDEVRALAFVAFLVGLSALVRLRSDPADVSLLAEDVSVEALAEDSETALEEAEARSRPLADGETLDPNRAPASELDRLPGVGPATAARIAAARDSAPFATSEDLLRVRGIGPATLEKMRPWLDVGDALPVGRVRPPRADERVDVNRADAGELESLPGIGPALAGRIVAERARLGGFRSVDDLLGVRGIGPATLERLRERVVVR